MSALALVNTARAIVVMLGLVTFLWVVARGIRTWDKRNTEEHLLVGFLTLSSFAMALACGESLTKGSTEVTLRPVTFIVALSFLFAYMWCSRGKRIHVVDEALEWRFTTSAIRMQDLPEHIGDEEV